MDNPLIVEYWDSFKELFPYSIIRHYDNIIGSNNLYLEVLNKDKNLDIEKYNDFMCENIDKNLFYHNKQKLKSVETQLINLHNDTQMQRKRYQRCIFYVIYGEILLKYFTSPLSIPEYKINDNIFQMTNIKVSNYFIIQPYTYYQFIPLKNTLLYCNVLEQSDQKFDNFSTIYYDSNNFVDPVKKRKSIINLDNLNGN
jgi:hypothetical protein